MTAGSVFQNFSQCLSCREIIMLKTLPKSGCIYTKHSCRCAWANTRKFSLTLPEPEMLMFCRAHNVVQPRPLTAAEVKDDRYPLEYALGFDFSRVCDPRSVVIPHLPKLRCVDECLV